MLQLTLPLFEQDEEKVASMKTIQLFILNSKDFDTAVDYLSKKAGMQHYPRRRESQHPRRASLTKPPPMSRPRGLPGTSNVGSPLVPLMGNPVRPQSQGSIHALARSSPFQPVYRSRIAGPNRPHSSIPGTAIPSRRRTPLQGNRYSPSQLEGPRDPRGSFVPNDSSHPRRLLSTGPDGEVNPLYNHSLQYGAERPPPLNHDVETGTSNVPDEPYQDRFHGKPASQSDQILSSAPRTASTRTSPFEGRPLSRPPTGRPASRLAPFSFSYHRVPIRIQVLSRPGQPTESRLDLKVRWEFTMELLPSTKMWALYLHAASYIRQKYRVTVDNKTLAAQNMDGTPLEDQDSLSDEILQGGTLRLVEHRPLSMARSTTVNPNVSGTEPSHPDWRPEVGQLDGSQPALPRDPLPHAFDETDQVPPRRPLPFRSVNTPALPRSSSPTATARPSLSEKPGLMNADARSRANKRLAKPTSRDVSTEPAVTKQPNSSQKQVIITSRRPSSSASRRRLDPLPGVAASPEPQTSARRPKTSLGIRGKRKAVSGDETVLVTTPSAIGSLQSISEVIGKDGKDLATRSCVGCRNNHRKCDRSKPACSSCRKAKTPCTYPSPPNTVATGHIPEKVCNTPHIDNIAQRMTLGSQTLASPPVTADALTQTCHPREYRDNGSQTQGIEQGNQDVEMNDVGTEPYNLYTDASTETDKCNDLWVPFSQCAQAVLWASNQYERKIQKAAEILKTTHPSQDDYLEKVAQAAVYGWEFETELRERFEQSLKT